MSGFKNNPFAVLDDETEGSGNDNKSRKSGNKSETNGRGRAKDRHVSGTGRYDSQKKGGKGGHNWGTFKDDLKAQNSFNDEEGVQENAEEEEDNTPVRDLETYLKEAEANSVSMEKEARQVEDNFDDVEVVERNDDDLFEEDLFNLKQDKNDNKKRGTHYQRSTEVDVLELAGQSWEQEQRRGGGRDRDRDSKNNRGGGRGGGRGRNNNNGGGRGGGRGRNNNDNSNSNSNNKDNRNNKDNKRGGKGKNGSGNQGGRGRNNNRGGRRGGPNFHDTNAFPALG